MKKIRLLLCAMLLCALSLMAMAACEAGLDSPGEIRLDTTTLTISWDKVPGAFGYSIKIGDQEPKTTKANSYSLVDLEPGIYTIQVKALGDGEDIRDSVTVTRKIERKYETGLSYRLINNNTEYQLRGVGSASGDVVMENYYREKPVTSIAPSALANNSSLTSFTVNDFVTTIPERAFYNSTALTKVVIRNNVTKIEKNAFHYCKVLEEVVISDSVTEIGNYAFSYCRMLENLQMSNSVVRIGNYAFSDCTSLKEINIPDSVKEIGDYAFSDCRAATSIYIGENVETIGAFAFYSLKGVDRITLPNSLKTIGNNAFEECILITAIAFPDSVISIGDNAFASCTALASIEIGENLESIGTDAFLSTPYVENYPQDIVYVGNWILTCKNTELGDREDISKYFLAGAPIGIADYAFYKCSKFTSADISTVKYVGKYAFSQCKNLMTVNLGEPCTIINEGAFVDCENLRNVKISKSSVKFIDAFAFVNCKNLNSIDLPDTLEMIGSQAFLKTGLTAAVDGVIYADNWVVGTQSTEVSNITVRDGTVGIAMYSFINCRMIGSVKLPNSLKVIGKGAFAVCSTISIEEMPTSLERIEDYAFYGCNGGNFGGEDYDIVLPDSLTYIGRSAFYGASVMGLEIPSSCKYIGDYAFWGTMYLGAEVNFNTVMPDGIVKTTKRFYLTLNEGIEYIGSRAFFNCGVIDLVIPDSVTEIGIRAFYGCDKMKTVTIGHGLTKIPDFAFYGCTSLEEVHLSNGTVVIGKQAFQNCTSLTTIELSKTLTTIEDAAFLGCDSLANLELPAAITTIGNHAFRGMWSDGAIILPAGVIEIGDHAFYGDASLTIYAEGDNTCSEYWGFWNSSWRPVIYGCTLSPDKSYVVSIVKTENNVTNSNAIGGISGPERSGYTFLGWATYEGGEAVYAAADISSVANGTTLFAVWQEQLAQ